MEEPIDIPEAQAEYPEALRDALVDQFGYLVDERSEERRVGKEC